MRKVKKVAPELFTKDKFGICHHHFLDRPTTDHECLYCACQFRGFCRK